MNNEFDLSNGGGLKRRFLDLLFPNRCPFCDGFIPFDRLCCRECFDKVLWSDEFICPHCGKFAPSGCICPVNCDSCVTAAYYEGMGRNGIISLKYKGQRDAALIFGRVLADKLRIEHIIDKVDIAVPVPMAKKAVRDRGFNQSELIADCIVSGTDIPVKKDLLGRRIPEREQHLLTAEERIQAAAEQYYINEKVPEGTTVLLVDDVITTGSTIRCCTDLLLANGAGRVIWAVAATVK